MRKRSKLLNLGKNILIGGMALAAFLYGGNEARAGDYFSEPEQKLEQRVSERELNRKKDINVIFNYYTENEQKPANYLTSQTTVYQSTGNLRYTPNILNINNNEISGVENIIKDIKNRNINSYSDFIGRDKNLSEPQKLLLLSAIGNLSGRLYERSKDKVNSQDDLFFKWQDYLVSGIVNPIGECDHIHSGIEGLANDIGIKAAAVSGAARGEGHIYTIAKTKEGSAIIDYGELFITDTKNIERFLEACQKDRGMTKVKHDFFENAEFKYRFITDDGRNLLDFLGYDETSEPLKNLLIYDVEKNARINLIFEQGNNFDSSELNFLGFFAKAGEIKGAQSSPLKNIKLFQGGYKRKTNFEITNNFKLSLDGNLSFLSGKINQDLKIESNRLTGLIGNWIVNVTGEKEKFNFSVRSGKTSISIGKQVIFYDSTIGTGISYKFTNEIIDIEPYALIQYPSFKKDLGTEKSERRLNDFGGGILFNILPSNNVNISVEPYYTGRIWEDEFGANAKIKSKTFGLNAGGYITNSKYDFCPDKTGVSIGLHKDFGRWRVSAGYERQDSDYDGEIEKERKFNIGAGLKF